MFGYITPDKSKLLQQDFVLYRAFYCGVCLQIGRDYGNIPRFTTSYDITFLSALVHDVTSQEVEFKECRCLGNPLTKKLTVCENPLLKTLCAVNLILTYHKLNDDVIDGGGLKKKLARKYMSKSHLKAKEIAPGVDEIVSKWYDELRALEKANESSIDKVSHCFAMMLKSIAVKIVGDKSSEEFASLCYNIGKFVYIADALDDIDEDAKSGNYNPFLVGKSFSSRRKFITDNRDEIEFLFACTVNRATESFNKMKFTQSYNLLKNVVYYGLREKVKQLLASEKKLSRPEI
ncbi:MAG: hypothetical protein IKC64_03815 [Clostridia bacterium]|nr:hypothetical protein [Clostridia bacterium]